MMCLIRTTTALSIILVVGSHLLAATKAGWVDPDSPANVQSTKALSEGDNRHYTLVFSDEFEQEGRTFRDGEDPRWTAINKNDITNNPLHYYSHDSIRSQDGELVLTTKVDPRNFSEYNTELQKYESQYKEIKSGMIQSWNKFCFTGGIVELRATLPGKPRTGGLWPAIWMMGNLARATFINSTENMWPFSTNVCDKRTRYSQLINSCPETQNAIYGMQDETRGRGAPEIDMLEVMYMDIFADPLLSTSLQVAPGTAHHRPVPGQAPNKSVHWYHDIEYGNKTTPNTYFYGVHVWQKDKRQIYQTDAISSNTYVMDEPDYLPHTFRVEWEPPDEDGSGGYLKWYMDGNFLTSVYGYDLQQTSNTEIPSEPMSLVINTAISKDWGFPDAWFLDCKCKCWSCLDPCCRQCALPRGYCENFPAHFKIDYVRVYQVNGDETSKHTLGCSPALHPTTSFIEARKDNYKLPGQKEPLLPVKTGGGSCQTDSDCGNTPDQGTCSSKKVCTCQVPWTGPHCQAHAGFYGDDNAENLQTVFSSNLLRSSFVFLFVVLIIFVLRNGCSLERKHGNYDKILTEEASDAEEDDNSALPLSKSYQQTNNDCHGKYEVK